MADEKRTCDTRLLSDAPTTEDAFGHAKVADAVAGLITTEQGGKCIGLRGSWGSGKSSVVELLRNRLRHAGEGNIDVFVFDAWAHQGDPLRRTFLEQLIGRLADIKWLKRSGLWAEKKEELSKRLEVIETTSEPVLTPLGGAFAVAILLIPLGFELLRYLTDIHKNRLAFVIFCFVLVCSPFLLVFATWLFWRPSWDPWEKRFWTHRDPYSKRSLLALFLNKTQERTVSNAVRTPDPTSVEFQSVFSHLIEEALREPERRLLIVVDNLDRVETKDALTIWATLKTFFDFDAGRGAPCFGRLWLLVPFDEIAIRNLWAADEEASVDLGQSFVDKTFQTIFRVSPPVLSDWQDFLAKQLKTAFPNHDPDDFHRVYRIYDLCAVSGKKPPTPRDIKLFVNSVGAIHRQWQDKISLPLQALYVLLSKDDRNLAEDLALKRESEILTKVPVDMVGGDWRESLAAIHFNVPKDRALQVMVGGRIAGCITSGDGRTLKQLASITGFTRVLERQIEQYQLNWGGPETRSLAILASNLSDLTDIDDASWNNSWHLACENALKVERWSQFDGPSGAGLVELVKRSANSELVDAILRSVSKSFPEEPGPSEIVATQTKSWLEGSAKLLKFLEAEHKTAIEQHFTLRAAAAPYLRAIIVSANDRALDGLRQFLRPTADASAIVSELSKLAADGKFDAGCASAITILKTIGIPWPWQSLVAALASRLSASTVLATPEIKTVLGALTDFSEAVPEAKKAVVDLTSTGHLSHHLATAVSDGQAAALCILPILRAVTSGGAISLSAPNSAAGTTVLNEILQTPDKRPAAVSALVDLIVKNREVDLLYEIPAKTSGTEPFLRTIFSRIVDGGKGYESIPPNEIIGREDFLKKTLGPELFDRIIDQSVVHAGLASELSSSSFAPDRVGIYRAALRHAAKDEGYLAFLTEGLRSVDKSTWLLHLSSEGPLLDLLTETTATGVDIRLTSAFELALFEHAQGLIDGKFKVERLRTSWDAVVDALDKNFQLAVLKRMTEILYNSHQPTDPLLDLYGARLAAGPVLAGNEERLALVVFPKFLESLRVAQLEWLCSVLQGNPNFLTQVKPETKETLETRIVESTEQSPIGEEAKKLVERLAQLAGIDIEKAKERRRPKSAPPEGGGEHSNGGTK